MKKRKTFRKLFLSLIIGILLSSVAYPAIQNNQFGSVIKGDALDPNEEVEVVDNNILKEKSPNNEDEQFEKDVKKARNKVKNILLVGVDAPDVNKIKDKEGPTGFRTDTIMIASIKNDEVDVISIPRDSLVYIGNKQDKINHAHSFGGMKLLIDTIENNFDIEIDKYARVDYKIVEEITKDIGGVDVIIDEEMKYTDPTPDLGIDIDFSPGEHNLQGRDAVRFLRYRSSEGDLYRVKNQQYFIEQFIKKVYSNGIVKSSKTLIENSFKYVDTNLNIMEMFGLVNTANKIEPENINFHILNGSGKYINKVSYYIIDDFDELKEIIYTNYSNLSD